MAKQLNIFSMIILMLTIPLISACGNDSPEEIPNVQATIDAAIEIGIAKIPTATPTQEPTATPTPLPLPTPTPLPPGDLGYVKTSVITSYNFTSFGEQVTIGIPIEKSPIVDHNQNGDITDGVTTSDDNNFKILSVTQRKNSESQIVLLCLTPINTSVEITFWTTRK